MKTLTLPLVDSNPPAVVWEGHRSELLKRNVAWTSPQLPGITVMHCGHPTALYPYWIDGIPSLRGRTFRLLADAQQAAEGAAL